MSKFNDVIKQPWEYKVSPFKIIGEIYYVGNKHVSVYLLKTDKGLVLLDTALPQTLYQLWDSIYMVGQNPREIRHIFHTHAHYDHIGGTRAIQEISGAVTYLGKDDIDFLENRQELIGQDFYGCDFVEYFKTDVALRGGEVYDFGNLTIECVHTPGHTPGTITYFIRFRYCGRDVIAALLGGFGTNTLTDEYLKKFHLDDTMCYAFKDSVQMLMERKVDILLGSHPMHNKTFEKAAVSTPTKNCFVNPAEWQILLRGRLDAVNNVLRVV
jgi:metallo-beta-lactamase class B